MMEGPILVLAAHPDDEVLGCGGTIARLTDEGKDVHVRILGEGVTSRYQTPEEAPAAKIEELHASSRRAANILGVKSHDILGLPDNRFDTVPLLDIVKVIERYVHRLNPRTVFTQNGGDLNIDHQRTYRAALTATRPMEGASVEAVYAYEVASSTEWAFQSFSPEFSADTYVDISGTLEMRVEALGAYELETRRFPHPRSPQGQRILARRWGSIIGCDAAEAFSTVRKIIR